MKNEEQKEEQDAVENMRAATANLISSQEELNKLIGKSKINRQHIVDKAPAELFQKVQDVENKINEIIEDQKSKKITGEQAVAKLRFLNIN